jgi:hypothetical protein
MRDLFSYYPESVDNNVWLANSIGEIDIGLSKARFPNFKIKECDDYKEFQRETSKA